MKVGDLVRTKKNGDIGVVVGNWQSQTGGHTMRGSWFRIFFVDIVGQEFGPADGICIQNARHLEVVSESR